MVPKISSFMLMSYQVVVLLNSPGVSSLPILCLFRFKIRRTKWVQPVSVAWCGNKQKHNNSSLFHDVCIKQKKNSILLLIITIFLSLFNQTFYQAVICAVMVPQITVMVIILQCLVRTEFGVWDLVPFLINKYIIKGWDLRKMELKIE